MQCREDRASLTNHIGAHGSGLRFQSVAVQRLLDRLDRRRKPFLAQRVDRYLCTCDDRYDPSEVPSIVQRCSPGPARDPMRLGN